MSTGVLRKSNFKTLRASPLTQATLAGRVARQFRWMKPQTPTRFLKKARQKLHKMRKRILGK